jgi:hypothetical protein
MIDTEWPTMERIIELHKQALWHIEQHIECTDEEQKSSAHVKTPKEVQRRRHQMTSEIFIADMQRAIAVTIQDMVIDYVRLAKRCIRLVNGFRKMWNIE